MWCGAVVRSRHEGQRRPEELGRRQSTTVYDGRSVMMMTLREDDLEPPRKKEGCNNVNSKFRDVNYVHAISYAGREYAGLPISRRRRDCGSANAWCVCLRKGTETMQNGVRGRVPSTEWFPRIQISRMASPCPCKEYIPQGSPHLQYQLLKTCSSFIFSHVLTSPTVSRVRTANIARGALVKTLAVLLW